ncbi:MAG TPA: hypothetical protein VN922_19420 [Bacteroidia bacterium]|nr:hypothetical protein [Bacteroidia bacterium]
MKKNYPVTPEAYKMIEKAALALPEMRVLGPDGKGLKRRRTKVNLTEFDTSKKRIHTNYDADWEPVIVNHKNEMVIAYKKQGQKGVDAYIEMITKIDRQSTPIRFMREIMRLKDLDAEVVGYDAYWIEQLAEPLNTYYTAHPEEYKDAKIAFICKGVTLGVSPDEFTANHPAIGDIGKVEAALLEFVKSLN